jgi:carboxymethylenebutenolidase
MVAGFDSPSGTIRSALPAGNGLADQRHWERRCDAVSDAGRMREEFFASALWLKARPDSSGQLGAVGLCFGGGVVNQLAVRMAWIWPQGCCFMPCSQVPRTRRRSARRSTRNTRKLNTRITSGWPAFDTALTAAGVPHEGHIYKGANHGFHNDTTPRYDEAAGKEAWQRTLDWFGKYLKA